MEVGSVGMLFTLSVSIVAISSSCSTWSPTSAQRFSMKGGQMQRQFLRFDHDFKVPSVIDSAISGTLTVWSAGKHEPYAFEPAGVNRPWSQQPVEKPKL